MKKTQVWKRNRGQYGEFRKAFRKWSAKYRPLTAKAKVSSESVTLYAKDKSMIATYFAPDYTKYMKWIWRGYL